MTTVISVENLNKAYRLGQIGGRTLSEDLNRWWAKARHKPDPYLKLGQEGSVHRRGEYIWALKDISFTVQQGEVLGIIGRNGAGKSTLLKILSRVTAPTSGLVKIKGRVASLLEVGTGFHIELTGRENIYLNGAILGMKRSEIARKFDEIVDFSGLEKFIDTPVKRYSSGMYVRLAFAVAAHLEPEILLVDEVLAVGDAEFQKKCLGKMGEVAKGGRTVLFVSHQLTQVRRLCTRGIWLERGAIQLQGDTADAVNAYEVSASQLLFNKADDKKSSRISKSGFLQWRIAEADKEQPNVLSTTGPLTLEFLLELNQPIHKGDHWINIRDSNGQVIWSWATDNLEFEPGRYILSHRLPALPIQPGPYQLIVNIRNYGKTVDLWYCVPELIVNTEPISHPWAELRGVGILNLNDEFHIRPAENFSNTILEISQKIVSKHNQ